MPIIPLSDDSLQSDSWQLELRHAIRSVAELSQRLNVTLADVPTDFPLLVPQAYVSRMKQGDVTDPLLRQILPVTEEHHVQSEHFSLDPLKELANIQGQPSDQLGNPKRQPNGLIQKYHGRALIIATGACAVNCRYCFRRHFPYSQAKPSKQGWSELIDYVAKTTDLKEVILSGGDPLIMKDDYLGKFMRELDAIPHVEMLRIHTRTPIVLPSRVCNALTDWISTLKKPLTMVLHSNHPNEIDSAVAAATAKLKEAGVNLLNQSVLLRDVNDQPQTLIALSKRLFQAGVLPYYLHVMDPVAGAEHFDVPPDEGHLLIRAMSEALPGYLVPRFVQEVPGTLAKQILQAP